MIDFQGMATRAIAPKRNFSPIDVSSCAAMIDSFERALREQGADCDRSHDLHLRISPQYGLSLAAGIEALRRQNDRSIARGVANRVVDHACILIVLFAAVAFGAELLGNDTGTPYAFVVGGITGCAGVILRLSPIAKSTKRQSGD